MATVIISISHLKEINLTVNGYCLFLPLFFYFFSLSLFYKFKFKAKLFCNLLLNEGGTLGIGRPSKLKENN